MKDVRLFSKYKQKIKCYFSKVCFQSLRWQTGRGEGAMYHCMCSFHKNGFKMTIKQSFLKSQISTFRWDTHILFIVSALLSKKCMLGLMGTLIWVFFCYFFPWPKLKNQQFFFIYFNPLPLKFYNFYIKQPPSHSFSPLVVPSAIHFFKDICRSHMQG